MPDDESVWWVSEYEFQSSIHRGTSCKPYATLEEAKYHSCDNTFLKIVVESHGWTQRYWILETIEPVKGLSFWSAY